jgi:hypothetical protein
MCCRLCTHNGKAYAAKTVELKKLFMKEKDEIVKQVMAEGVL